MTAERRLPFECVTLLLQGGGALGAYQGGVYEALAEANIHPDWVAGISIGAINAAIIAGNPPNCRVDRLREFWTHVTSSAPWDWLGNPFGDLARSDDTRNLLNQMSANFAVACGATGFFSARAMMPWLQPGGTLGAIVYDTGDLKHTLERRWILIASAGTTPMPRGRGQCRIGNFVYWIPTPTRSGRSMSWRAAYAPAPAVEIDGEHYWRRPRVQHATAVGDCEQPSASDTLAFQVDFELCALPRNMAGSRHHVEISFRRTRAPASLRTCTGSSVP
jgi:NTE family protein